jgi:hypothetical protein
MPAIGRDRGAGAIRLAIEVSAAITKNVVPPRNLEVLITNGLELPVPPASVTPKYFDVTPTGFYLREYTVTQIGALMRNAGFSRVGLEKQSRSGRPGGF